MLKKFSLVASRKFEYLGLELTNWLEIFHEHSYMMYLHLHLFFANYYILAERILCIILGGCWSVMSLYIHIRCESEVSIYEQGQNCWCPFLVYLLSALSPLDIVFIKVLEIHST